MSLQASSDEENRFVIVRQPTELTRPLESLLPAQWLEKSAAELKVVQRLRKIDIVSLVWTLILGLPVGKKRTMTGLRRAYQAAAGATIAPSSFHDRFTPELTKLLRACLNRAINSLATDLEPRLKELVEGFRGLLAADSTVIRLHKALAGDYPACRTNHTKAAAKLHCVLNVVGGTAQQVKLTSERTNDRKPLKRVGQWVCGCLLLLDLGYYSFHLFSRIENQGGFFLSRLKSNGNPLIVGVNRKWRGASVDLVGQRLADVLPRLKRRVIDVVVEVSFLKRTYRGKKSKETVRWRLVGLWNEEAKRWHLYLTNLDVADFDADDVGELYRLRWQVELLFKSLRSQGRLGQLPSQKKEIIEALVLSSVLWSLCSRQLLGWLKARLPEEAEVGLLRWSSLFEFVGFLLLFEMLRFRRDDHPQQDFLLDLVLNEVADPNRSRKRALDIWLNP